MYVYVYRLIIVSRVLLYFVHVCCMSDWWHSSQLRADTGDCTLNMRSMPCGAYVYTFAIGTNIVLFYMHPFGERVRLRKKSRGTNGPLPDCILTSK